MTRGRKPNIVENTIKEELATLWYEREEKGIWPVWIDDIVSGVARLNWYGDREGQIPLSTQNIIKCFINLDTITTESVTELLYIKKSQATLYVKACKLCYPFLLRGIHDKYTTSLKYPNTTIISEAHAIERKYHIHNRALI